VAIKKKKLAGRSLSAVSKIKIINRDANQSIFSFISQSQSTRGVSEAPEITQPTEHSRIDCDVTQAGDEVYETEL
jgi:hypothetical protein